MRDFETLYREAKERGTYQKTSKIVDKLVIDVRESFTQGVTLKQNYEYRLQMQKVLQSEIEKQVKEKKSISPPVPVLSKETSFYQGPLIQGDFSTKEDFVACLPTLSKEKDFQELYSILFSLAKEKKMYVELLPSFTEEEQEIAQEEIERLQEKIDWIQEYLNPVSEEEISIGKEKNHLVFLETVNGNPCALNDMKSKEMKEDVYPSFLTLLQSIENGTFPRLRKLISTLNFYEVKLNQSRVLFSRIYENYYCIVACFVKKSDWQKDLNERKYSLMSLYAAQEKAMYHALEEGNSAYLERQQETLEELYQLLSPKGRKGEYVKWMK